MPVIEPENHLRGFRASVFARELSPVQSIRWLIISGFVRCRGVALDAETGTRIPFEADVIAIPEYHLASLHLPNQSAHLGLTESRTIIS